MTRLVIVERVKARIRAGRTWSLSRDDMTRDEFCSAIASIAEIIGDTPQTLAETPVAIPLVMPRFVVAWPDGQETRCYDPRFDAR